MDVCLGHVAVDVTVMCLYSLLSQTFYLSIIIYEVCIIRIRYMFEHHRKNELLVIFSVIFETNLST